MAGTTGLEPAASAVTAPNSVVIDWKTATRVAPKSGFGAFRNNYWTIIGPKFVTCFLVLWLGNQPEHYFSRSA